MARTAKFKLNLDSNNHSVFRITLHAIFCVKYRRRVITDEISFYIKDVVERIGKDYHVSLLEFNHDVDHVHALIAIHPNTPISKFINAWKSASSRLVKNNFPEVKEKLWKSSFWSQSYCLLSVGGANLETVKTYIESQGEP